MIDPSFDTVVHPYPPTMKELEEKYRDLEQSLAQKSADYDFVLSKLQERATQIDRFEEALKYNEWDFDQDTLQSLADYFNITLEREYEVTITVTFSGTVTAPYGYDIDDLENDLQATIDTHYYGNNDVVVDLSEDRMEIDYNEL